MSNRNDGWMIESRTSIHSGLSVGAREWKLTCEESITILRYSKYKWTHFWKLDCSMINTSAHCKIIAKYSTLFLGMFSILNSFSCLSCLFIPPSVHSFLQKSYLFAQTNAFWVLHLWLRWAYALFCRMSLHSWTLYLKDTRSRPFFWSMNWRSMLPIAFKRTISVMWSLEVQTSSRYWARNSLVLQLSRLSQ